MYLKILKEIIENISKHLAFEDVEKELRVQKFVFPNLLLLYLKKKQYRQKYKSDIWST